MQGYPFGTHRQQFKYAEPIQVGPRREENECQSSKLASPGTLSGALLIWVLKGVSAYIIHTTGSQRVDR